MIRIEFSSDKWPVLGLDAGNFPAFCSCRTHLSRERSSPFVDVEHGQHGEGSIDILRQAAIANLGEAPETLQGQKWVFDLGTYTRLSSVCGLVSVGQRTVVGARLKVTSCAR